MRPHDGSASQDPAEKPRAEYVAPAIAWEDRFEAEANLGSACGKLGGGGGLCSITGQS